MKILVDFLQQLGFATLRDLLQGLVLIGQVAKMLKSFSDWHNRRKK